MTAPDPHASPPGRLDGPGRRGVLAAGRAAVREVRSDAEESPLRQALRATAAHPAPVARAAAGSDRPAQWRRPERHMDAAPVVVPPPTDTGPVAADDEVPPILRAMLASRADGESRDATPDADDQPVDAAPSTVVEGDEPSGSLASDPEPDAAPAAVPHSVDPEPVAPEPVALAAAVFTAPAAAPEPSGPETLLGTAPRSAPEPITPAATITMPDEAAAARDVAIPTRRRRSVATPTRRDTAAIVAALPFARLAAVACAEGEQEPPLCHPAAAVVSRARALSPLRAAVRHARRRRRLPLLGGVAAASVLVVSLATAATAAFATMPGAYAEVAAAPSAALEVSVAQDPPPIVSLDEPATAGVAAVAFCDVPEVQAALAAVDPTALIVAAGGAQAFRDAVVAGAAPCVPLGDSAYPWVVVNKQRPNGPVDFSPSSIVLSEGVSSLAGGGLRPDAAAALAALVDASRAAGAGDIAVESAFRSFDTQTTTHDEQVASAGAEEADLSSARPGYSEHQTGLAADLVACDGGCGSLDDFGATAQGQWVAANAWQYGWIVRYEADTTAITGYIGEPWHLRYIGPELAALYQAGGFRTLEEFWGLPAAPTY